MVQCSSRAAIVPRCLAWALALAAAWLLLALVAPADRASAEPRAQDAIGSLVVDAGEGRLDAVAGVEAVAVGHAAAAVVENAPAPTPALPATPASAAPSTAAAPAAPGPAAEPLADPAAATVGLDAPLGDGAPGSFADDLASALPSVPEVAFTLDLALGLDSPVPIVAPLLVVGAIGSDHATAAATSAARPPQPVPVLEKPPTAGASTVGIATLEQPNRFSGAPPPAGAISAPVPGAAGALGLVASLAGLVLLRGRAVGPVDLDGALGPAREHAPSPD